MPVTDASALTSVTASLLDPLDADDVPIELKIPLPSSNPSSEEEGETKEMSLVTHQDTVNTPFADAEVVPPQGPRTIPSEPTGDDRGEAPLAEAARPSPISLEDMAHLIDLERYQRVRTRSIQARLTRLSLSCGLDRRLISSCSIAYGNMIDQYKTDDQAGFGGLYEAYEQLKGTCDASRNAVDLPDMNAGKEFEPLDNTDNRSYIQLLPSDDQDTILRFLKRIRTEANFLSDRIHNLSPEELTGLTSLYHPAGIDFSVLPNHSHGKTQFYSRDSQMMKLSRRMDNLHRFHNQDPFFALLYSVFDSSARPGSQEYARRIDIWATACARNMVGGFLEAKPGSDELIIATIDSFTDFRDWAIKPRMETYLMRILVEGSFLLDSPLNQPKVFKESIETYNAKAVVAEVEFFEKALTDLFGLLAIEPNHQAVPEGALLFVHAILRKIKDPKLRHRAKVFIVCRWYFATLMSSIVVYPEVRGIMLTHHIDDNARERILQKLVVRMQEDVFGVILPGNGLVKSEVRNGIMAVFQCFEPPAFNGSHLPARTRNQDEGEQSMFLMLSHLDIIGLVQTLYPERDSAPSSTGSTDPDPAPPSTAGSSTLNPSDAGSVVAPSSGPSTSGTSMISGTIVDETSDIEGAVEKEELKNFVKDEHVGPPFKPPRTAKTKFAMLLKNASRKLASLFGAHGQFQWHSSSKAWAFIYYSNQTPMLTMDQNMTREGLPGISAKSPAFEAARGYSSTEGYRTLKTGITRLIADIDRLGNYRIAVPAKARFTQITGDHDSLELLMVEAMTRAQTGLNFGAAHFWWNIRSIYRDYLSSNHPQDSGSLLQSVADDLRSSAETAAQAARANEIQLRSLKGLQEYQTSVLANMDEQRKALRVKMWYVSDVRHSASYEEALYVTRALRAMASTKRAKQPGSMANWARQRLRGSSPYTKSDLQTLEALSAPKNLGGQSKLADEQIEITSRWLTRRSIENFCKGEERIHRFCFEVQKCLGKIAGVSLLESPVLWSSNLFKRERESFDAQRPPSRVPRSSYRGPTSPPIPYEYGRLQYSPRQSLDPPTMDFVGSKAKQAANSFGGFWNPSQPSPEPTGLGLHGFHPPPQPLPPTPTTPSFWSNGPFNSSSPMSASTAPSFSLVLNRETEASPAKKAFIDHVKSSLCSLLISDLGYLLWNQGTETDCWINEYAVHMSKAAPARYASDKIKVADTASQEVVCLSGVSPQADTPNVAQAPGTEDRESGPHSGVTDLNVDTGESFPFSDAYGALLLRMSLCNDPYFKLQLLFELEDLISQSIQQFSTTQCLGRIADSAARGRHSRGNRALRGTSVPRTKATSLEEVIANCTERRAGTLRSRTPRSAPSLTTLAPELVATDIAGTDEIVETLLSIFRDTKLRPKTLFRDLQYIAAFVSPDVLDRTAQGKAFWDVGLAALALKEDLCTSTINRANEITAYHISTSKLVEPTTDSRLVSTTLRDAANLWLIAAKEGSPVAARELGLFYLTHPELLPRVTLPFSKSGDVFKSAVSSDTWAGDKEKGALDPLTFAVVFHWMEIAANGGDKDARDFLRANGELSAKR